MSIRIANDSVSVVVVGYTITADNPAEVVYLDIAPNHPKSVGAIRAELTSNSRKYLTLSDRINNFGRAVVGLGHGYRQVEAVAEHMAAGHGARALHLRMIAPEAIAPENPNLRFFALEWKDPATGAITVTVAQALVAALERTSPYPVMMTSAWGEYLLQQLLLRDLAAPLLTAGNGPTGVEIRQGVAWDTLIAEGVARGALSLKIVPA